MFRFISALLCSFSFLSLPGPGSNQCQNRQEHFKKPDRDTVLVISGLILDQATGRPLENLNLQLQLTTIDSVTSAIKRDSVSLYTDDQGFYFWKGLFRLARAKNLVSIIINSRFGYFYKEIEIGHGKSNFYCATEIRFLNKREKSKKTGKTSLGIGKRNDRYSIDYPSDFVAIGDSLAVKAYLMDVLPTYKAENALITGFLKSYTVRELILTKYGSGYFDQRGELLGYEGKVSFYLDGVKVGFEQINDAFKNFQPASMKTDRPWYGIDFATYMKFYTSELDTEIPPQKLVNRQNVSWIELNALNMASLDSFPIYVNGYWQVEGLGANKVPLKIDIQRVALFKGPLANHYNRRFEKVWWIETKPADAVWARPEFEKCGCGL